MSHLERPNFDTDQSNAKPLVNSDPITYLHLDKSFQVSAEEALSKTLSEVVSQAGLVTLFKVPEGCLSVVDEAERLYQLQNSMSKSPVPYSKQGAVLREIFKSGGTHNTVIFPMVGNDNVRVMAWNKDGEEVGEEAVVDWHWRKAIYVSRPTYFRIEKGKEVSCILVSFRR